MRIQNNQRAFFVILRAGLWEQDVNLSQLGDFDFIEVSHLAEEQSVLGLVAAGLEHIVDVCVPQEFAMTLIGQVLWLEQHNTSMNKYVARLIDLLRKHDVYALLVKGQGIAQCYERPLWRACGDIDLLLSKDNYNRAKSFLLDIATAKEPEDKQALHLGLTIDGWLIELHGSLRSCCLSKMDKTIDVVQKDVFFNGSVRSWINGDTQVFLPSPNNDVFLVFTHIIKHYFNGGVGLRQVCDWCRLLWTYRETIDRRLLETWLNRAGIMTEWKAFASYAVDYLGMPVEAMPFYDAKVKWSHKAKRINAFIIDNGNFGHNRDSSYYVSKPYLIRKYLSFKRHTADGLSHLSVFPLDSIRVWGHMFILGIKAVLNGNKG